MSPFLIGPTKTVPLVTVDIFLFFNFSGNISKDITNILINNLMIIPIDGNL